MCMICMAILCKILLIPTIDIDHKDHYLYPNNIE